MIKRIANKRSAMLYAMGLLGLTAVPGLASAAGETYQATIVCGMDPTGVVARIVPGHYLTTVGIQNPSDKKTANIKMRVSLTFPPAAAAGAIAAPGPVSDMKTAQLKAYEAMEVSCDQIVGDGVTSAFFASLPQRPNHTPFPYVQGFLIVEADHPVAVSEAHTTSADANSPVSSINVLQLQPTKK